MVLKLFARGLSSISKESSFLTLPNGKIIPYPRGSIREIKAGSVIEYGEKAIEVFLPETNDWNKLKNVARLRYLEMREDLLRSWRGRWVAVNPEGLITVASTEEKVLQMAEAVFPYRVDEYYAACVGCEILRGAVMNDSSTDHAGVSEFNLPPGMSSGLSGKENSEFVIRAEHSFLGRDFRSYIMKHNSGATMMGVPRDILSNPPSGVVLQRHEDVHYIGPDGSHRLARVFRNNYIRVAGVTVKVDVIESRTWLLGFPILSHFRNMLDVSAKEVVVLDPLPNIAGQLSGSHPDTGTPPES
jgi:hypothetical protein